MNCQENQCELSEMSDAAEQTTETKNGVEGSDGGTADLPAVTRSARLKQQRNWKWKWWCFTKGRVLQPISETAEVPKDESPKDEDNSSSDEESKNQDGDGVRADEQWRNNVNRTKQDGDGAGIHDICIATESLGTTPKDQYSACYKLIEKFQEAVLDNAVRIIQAAFKRFTLRRRFLRWRKAATVIQRNVRKWLHNRNAPVHLEAKETAATACVTDANNICENLGSCFVLEEMDTSNADDDVEVTGSGIGHHMEEDSTGGFLQPDSWGHPPSLLQHIKLEEADAVSLTDSGIDGCSVASVEAVLEDNGQELKAVTSIHSNQLASKASLIDHQVEETQCQNINGAVVAQD